MTDILILTVEVAPVSPGLFDPFIMDVPTLSDEDVAARRSWWSAFHLLGPRGVEPEEFTVYEWIDSPLDAHRERQISSGGFVN